jgi:hypothetical protein
MAKTDSIALFEDRLILDPRPPVTDAELADVARRCGRPVPAGLIDLWRVSFGGHIDYDLRVDFDGEIASFSFTELFYPGSKHYHDLPGWIDHERGIAEEHGRPAGGPLRYLPFGGFEYLDRVYVGLDEGPDSGAVFAWMQALPPAWKRAPSQDSVARIADDVPAFFRLLTLEHDPFAPDVDSYAAGQEMVAAISALPDRALAAIFATKVRATIIG